MRNRSSLLGHATVFAVGLGLQGLGAILVLPFITRSLGPAEYGRVSVALVVMATVALLVSGGLQLVVFAEYYRDRDGIGARALAGAVATVGAVVALAATTTLLLVDDGGARLLASSVAAAAGVALVGVEQAILRARRQPGSFVTVTLASTIGAQVVGLACTVLDPTAQAYMTGYAVAVLASAVGGAWRCRVVTPWRHWPHIRSRARLLAPVIPQSLLMLVLTGGDVALVFLLLGDVDAGRYQVAWLLSSVSYYLASALANAWSPRAMAASAEGDGWDYLARTGRILLGAIGSGAVVLSALAPILLPILAPPSFRPAELEPVVAVLVVSGPVALANLGATNVLLKERRTDLVLLAAAAGAVVLVVVAVSLLSSLGLLAAALAKVGGFLALGGFTLVAASRSVRRLASQWRIGLVLAATSLGSLGSLLALRSGPAPVRVVAGLGAVLLGVWLAAPAFKPALEVARGSAARGGSDEPDS